MTEGQLPKTGRAPEELFSAMREMKAQDADWQRGRTFSLIYPAGDDVDAVLEEANTLYMFENALNPFRFPSLRQMERDVVAMTASLLHAPGDFGGSMSSGGTESILLAVKTARDKARAERGVERPEMIVPYSAHPAFAKAAEYLRVDLRQAPLRDDLTADVGEIEKLMNEQTVLVVGSAPNYPHGVVDPIPDLAALASKRGASFHTDACIGGFLLPFLELLGYEVPPYDFRVDGVTSMSADVHKYGYCTKGASVILHRSGSALQYQSFLYDRWPGGLYGSLALAGARPAAPVAAAWAVMNYLGEEGYMRLASSVMETAKKVRGGIESIPGLTLWGNPVATAMAFGSQELDVMAVGDVMDERGWHLDRQTNPNALHLMLSPIHERFADEFLTDLAEAVHRRGESLGKEARYS